MKRKDFISGSLIGAFGLLAARSKVWSRDPVSFPEQVDSQFQSTWLDHIPVTWVLPDDKKSNKQLVIWQAGFSGSKDDMIPYLCQLADKGFTAVCFDNWQHGERTLDETEKQWSKVFKEFRRNMWPIIGNSVIDALRVIDWAQNEFQVNQKVFIGGFSMGGDIALATAGLDKRIKCVATTVSTPDWTRPGMKDFISGEQIDQGEPDAYAKFFYDRLNPITHTASYDHLPSILFECGAMDDHVPAEAALRFRSDMEKIYGKDKNPVMVRLHDNIKHQIIPEMWENCLKWFTDHLDKPGINK